MHLKGIWSDPSVPFNEKNIMVWVNASNSKIILAALEFQLFRSNSLISFVADNWIHQNHFQIKYIVSIFIFWENLECCQIQYREVFQSILIDFDAVWMIHLKHYQPFIYCNQLVLVYYCCILGNSILGAKPGTKMSINRNSNSNI